MARKPMGDDGGPACPDQSDREDGEGDETFDNGESAALDHATSMSGMRAKQRTVGLQVGEKRRAGHRVPNPTSHQLTCLPRT